MTTSSSIKPYTAFFSAQFRVMLQYRASALANVVTQFVFGFVHIMVFEAFYASSTKPMPISLPEVITYIWLTQATIAMIPYGMDMDIRDKVQTGAIGYELLRPLKLYHLLYARAMAQRTAPTLLRAIPLLTITYLFFDLRLPPTLTSAGAWVLSMFSALLLSSAITTFGSVIMFWTLSGEGIGRLLPIIIGFFSGMFLPLPLFPEWAKPVIEFLPFRGLIDIPFRLYLGNIPVSELPHLLLHQLLWTAIIIFVGHLILSFNLRKLVIQGG